MAMRKYKKLVATTGQYTGSDGQQKNRYQNVGTLFLRDDNTVCMKLDALPISNEWDGWINAYDLDDENQQQGQQPARQAAPAPAPAPQPVPAFDDGIPF